MSEPRPISPSSRYCSSLSPPVHIPLVITGVHAIGSLRQKYRPLRPTEISRSVAREQ